jgi:hypothetical protein
MPAWISLGAHPDSLLVTGCNDAGTGSLRDTVAAAVGGDAIDLRQLPCSTITLPAEWREPAASVRAAGI